MFNKISDTTYTYLGEVYGLTKTLPYGVYNLEVIKTMQGMQINFIKVDLSSTRDVELLGRKQNKFFDVLVKQYIEEKKTSALLVGDRGLGKTLLINKFIDFINRNYERHIVIINNSIHPDILRKVNNVLKPIFVIDEFEKKYNDYDYSESDKLNQEVFLDFLDGVEKEDISILLTANKLYDINNYLKARPSRIELILSLNTLQNEDLKDFFGNTLTEKEYKLLEQYNLNYNLLLFIKKYLNYGFTLDDILELQHFTLKKGNTRKGFLKINGKDFSEVTLLDDYIFVLESNRLEKITKERNRLEKITKDSISNYRETVDGVITYTYGINNYEIKLK